MRKDDGIRPRTCHDAFVSTSRGDQAGERRALEAIAATRARGGFFYAHLAGVTGGSTGEGSARLSVPPEPGHTRPSIMAVATLADLALGSALRSVLGTGLLMPTVDLTLTLVREPRGEVVGEARALAAASGADTATATCDLSDAGGPLGLASGTFALRPAKRPVRAMPWDGGPSAIQADAASAAAPLQSADLSPEERACLDAFAQAGAPAHESVDALDAALLTFSAPRHTTGETQAHVGPALANRAGHVHGGALMTFAVRTAQAALGHSPSELHTVTLQFLRPAAGDDLSGAAVVHRRGRSLAVVAVEVRGDSDVLATALVGLRIPPRPGGPRS